MPTSCIYVVEITEITRALIHNGCMLLRLLTKYVLIVTKGGYFFHLCVCECVCACRCMQIYEYSNSFADYLRS